VIVVDSKEIRRSYAWLFFASRFRSRFRTWSKANSSAMPTGNRFFHRGMLIVEWVYLSDGSFGTDETQLYGGLSRAGHKEDADMK
jgi:hypothetical protein